MPILVEGKTIFISLKGTIKIEGEVSYAMFRIGATDPIRSLDSTNLIDIEGTLCIARGAVLRQGIKLRISSVATIILDENAYIGDNNTIISDKRIRIGKNTRVGNNTTFMDTDFHFLIDINTRQINNNQSEIEIGEGNWIGGWCTIKKGTKTPDYTIVAGPYSMTSKDYTKTLNKNSIIGGSPARFIKEGMQRINNPESEHKITAYYKNNNEAFVLDNNTDLNLFLY